MSNFTEQHNKIAVHLQEVYKKHRELDEHIKVCHAERHDDLSINRLKTKKLWLKDEIHRLESQLKALR
jgi:hypothetical protein